MDLVWFGGNSDWAVNTNWAPNGPPGSSDQAIINAGSATLSFATVVDSLTMGGGQFSGTGTLSVSGRPRSRR